MNEHLEHPDDWLGLLAYRMADTGRFVQGPYASLKKEHVAKLDVAARLVGEKIQFNKDQMSEMGVGDSVVQMMGLVFHQALMHMDRRRMITGGLPQYQAAADLAAELAVWHKLEHPSQSVSNKFPKPGDFGFPEGESMEQYFKRLIDKAEQNGVDLEQHMQPQPGQGQPGQGQPGQGQPGEGGEGGEEGDPDDQESPSQSLAKALGSKKDTHKQDHQGWNQVSSVQQEAVGANLPERLESWMKSRGIEPAGFKRLIDEIRNLKKERWYDKLRRLVGTKMAARDYRHTIKRPSRRFGVPHAGRVRLRKGMLAVAVDTSGSIAQTELTVFISKLAGIAKAYEAPFEVIVCDADIHAIKKIARRKDVETVDLTGGGGTSSKPVFEYLEKHKVDMLVYLTDLFIDFPEEPPRYKVIWGVINRGKEDNFEPAPFGETYHLDVDENPEAMGPVPRRKR
jgi:hypothetical protein